MNLCRIIPSHGSWSKQLSSLVKPTIIKVNNAKILAQRLLPLRRNTILEFPLKGPPWLEIGRVGFLTWFKNVPNVAIS